MNIRKFIALLLVFAMAAVYLAGCGSAKKDDTEINVGVLKGPTGIGAIKIMDDSENGVYPNYHFTLTPEPTDIVARLSNGDLDIGALPTNVASNLYNKTKGGVQIIALNTLGVLYVLENGNTVNSPADLKGKTIYCNGKGNNPEFMINYIIRSAGLEPGKDVMVEFLEASDIATKMIKGDIDLCMLPVPAVTTVMMKNENVRQALDVAEEYKKAANDGSVLTMGCLVARTDFIKEHPQAVKQFLENYEASIKDVLKDVDAAAELVAKYEITGNAQIAAKAIPDASIVCITGKDLRPSVEGYYQVLFDSDPKSIGGAMPGDDFYYTGK
ncbi:MAG: ABC transporter substrate-binding protein [Firmicutes bacterium]|nr:ABC transporter substrate-binding protein [Bacillota bacterium]